jgi:cytoskeletal protein RodZ
MSDTQTESEQQAKEETQRSLGSLLKSYREQNGHDVYEVAEALCLSPEIITSLEKEDFDSLPEPPYVRGYLRSYAKFSNIDPQEIIDLYEEQRGADPQDLEYHFKPNRNNLTKSTISSSAIRLGLIALLLVGLAALSMIPAVNSWITETWAGFSKQTADKNIASAEPVAAENQFTLPAPLPGEEADQAEDNAESSNSDDTATTNNSVDATTDQTPKDDKKQGGADKEGNNNKPDAKEKNGTTNTANADEKIEDNKEEITETKEGTKLKFVFKKEVWMRIKDKNKKTVFESLSPAGEEKEIILKKPMTFRIGNAQGVEIYVEGKRLDITALTTGSVANFTID